MSSRIAAEKYQPQTAQSRIINHGKHPMERMQGGMNDRISLVLDVSSRHGVAVIGLQRAGSRRLLSDMGDTEKRIAQDLAREVLPRAETSSLIRHAKLFNAHEPLMVLIPKAISQKCAHDYLQFNTSSDSSPKDKGLAQIGIEQRHPRDTQKNGASK